MKLKNRIVFYLLCLMTVICLAGCRKYTFEEIEDTQIAEELKKTPEVSKIKDLTVSTQAGFGRWFRIERYGRTISTIQNEGEAFSGKIGICYFENKTNRIEYQKEITVGKNETITKEITFPVEGNCSEIKVIIYDEKDKEIGTQTLRLNISYISGEAYVGRLMEEDKIEETDSNEIRYITLTPEEFPYSSDAMDCLDAIVIDKEKEALLTDEQKEALYDYEINHEVFRIAPDDVFSDETEQQLISGFTEYTKRLLNIEAHRGSDSGTAYRSAGVIDEKNIPDILKYVIVITIYVVLIGPPAYFFLKKINKRNLLWVVVPAMSAVFTLLIFLIGRQTRQVNPFIGYLEIENIAEGNTSEEVFFTLSSPYNKNYSMSITGEYSVYQRQSDYYYADRGLSGDFVGDSKASVELLKDEKINQTILNIRNNTAFAEGYYQASKESRQGEALACDLSMGEDYKIHGTVTNNSGYNLTNCMLSVGDFYILLGNIEADQTMCVDDLEQSAIVSMQDLYQQNFIEKIAGGNPAQRNISERTARVYAAMEYLFEDRLNSFIKNDTILTGFVEENGEAALFEENPYEARGISMIIMNGTTDYNAGGRELIANVDQYAEAEQSYYYDVYRYIDSNILKYQITFDEKDKICELVYPEILNKGLDEKVQSRFIGKIKLYNNFTGQYDTVLTEEDGRRLTNLTCYLGNNNTLRVLLEQSGGETDGNSMIPVLSAIKEAP